MEKPYARVGENGVQYAGPATPSENAGNLQIGVFGPHAEEVVRSPEVLKALSALNANGQQLSLIAIPSDTAWGKASDDLVKAVYQDHVLALVALDRASSHLAEQIAVKTFVPVMAISSDRALTSTNIPWIFRLPDGSSIEQALNCLADAIKQAGPNRGGIRESLASGKSLAGIQFDSMGEAKR
jgi:ABC-type branched-subunit amino acid transport system substrate-binding protein